MLRFKTASVELAPLKVASKCFTLRGELKALDGRLDCRGKTVVADGMAKLSDLDYNGTLLSWVDYEAGLKRFNAEVMPLLEQKGLRGPS